ncbi:peptidoglycan-binding protein LysM [Streptomyces chartreusis]|uniref:peptidoglycan-binding protein LysM n=1 Tax=Streptomyces chartreusis TaxID=1969 RepID=UPI003D921E4F
MGVIWIDGAERLGAGKIGGAMDSPGKPPRASWHTTESGAGNAAFDAVGKYLRTIAAEPHILYDPTTDRLGQFGPLNQSARALRNDGATRTNRTGKVNIQIEVLARAATPFTGYWKPGPNFRKLMAAIRSWGVPDVFPMGALAGSYADTAAKRSRDIWLNKGGHFGHCNVPGNDHWDPGKISPTKLFAAAPTASQATKPSTSAKPKVDLSNLLKAAKTDSGAPQGHQTYPSGVRLVESALQREGYLAKAYAGDGSWGTLTQRAYSKWQNKLGFSGADADGKPGFVSLTKLGNKYGFTVVA